MRSILASVSVLTFLPMVAKAQQAAGTPSSVEAFLLPMAFMMGIFYLLVWRPQQKRSAQQAKFLTSLKRGDEVITSSGIYGEITGVTEKIITLQIADNVRIKILRTQVLGRAAEETAPAGAVKKGANT